MLTAAGKLFDFLLTPRLEVCTRWNNRVGKGVTEKFLRRVGDLCCTEEEDDRPRNKRKGRV